MLPPWPPRWPKQETISWFREAAQTFFRRSKNSIDPTKLLGPQKIALVANDCRRDLHTARWVNGIIANNRLESFVQNNILFVCYNF